MDSAEFFDIIDTAREETGPTDPSVDPAALRDVLSEMDSDKVREFASAFSVQLSRLNTWSLWGAGYVIAGGMGDDGFDYFRSWLIGKGRDAVEQAIADPDQLGLYLGEPGEDDDEAFENEELAYVAVEVLEELGLDEPTDDFTDGEPTGDPFDEDTVESQYPTLASRRGGEPA